MARWPLPANIVQVPIRGKYWDSKGAPAKNGKITFTPFVDDGYWIDISDPTVGPVMEIAVPFTITLDNNGQIPPDTWLIATDQTTLNPVNWTWKVDLDFSAQDSFTKTFYYSILSTWATDGIDLNTITPVGADGGTPQGGGGAGTVTMVNGVPPDGTGNVVVDIDDMPSFASIVTTATLPAQLSGYASLVYVNGLAFSAQLEPRVFAPSVTTYTVTPADHGYRNIFTAPGGVAVSVSLEAATAYTNSRFYTELAQAEGAGQVTVVEGGVPQMFVRDSTSGLYNNANNILNKTPSILMPTIHAADLVVVQLEHATSKTWAGASGGSGPTAYAFAEQPGAGEFGPTGAARQHMFVCPNAPVSISGLSLGFTITSANGIAVAWNVLSIGGIHTTTPIDNVVDTGTNNFGQAATLLTQSDGCGWLSLAGANNGATVYTTNPFLADQGTGAGQPKGIVKAVDIGMPDSPNANAAAAIGYHGTGGVLAPVGAAGTQIGGDVWSVAGFRGVRTVSLKPLPATGVNITSYNNLLKTAGPGAVLGLSRISANNFWLDGRLA